MLFPSVKWISVPESVQAYWFDLIPPVTDNWMDSKVNALHGWQKSCFLNIVHSLSAIGSFILKAARWIECTLPWSALRDQCTCGRTVTVLFEFGSRSTTLLYIFHPCNASFSKWYASSNYYVWIDPFLFLLLSFILKKKTELTVGHCNLLSHQVIVFYWQGNWRHWTKCFLYAFLGLQRWCWWGSECWHAGHLSKNRYVSSV